MYVGNLSFGPVMPLTSLVPRPSLSLSFAVTIFLEAGKKELVPRQFFLCSNNFGGRKERTKILAAGKKELVSCLQNCYCKKRDERRPGNEASSHVVYP